MIRSPGMGLGKGHGGPFPQRDQTADVWLVHEGSMPECTTAGGIQQGRAAGPFGKVSGRYYLATPCTSHKCHPAALYYRINLPDLTRTLFLMPRCLSQSRSHRRNSSAQLICHLLHDFEFCHQCVQLLHHVARVLLHHALVFHMRRATARSSGPLAFR